MTEVSGHSAVYIHQLYHQLSQHEQFPDLSSQVLRKEKILQTAN